MYQPKHDSKRSKRRSKRGFVSLEISSRKHRRANNRQISANKLSNGDVLKPGEKVVPRTKDFEYTGSGKLNYH